MKKKHALNSVLFITLFLIFTCFLTAQAKIIFDTDFGGDADDLGALAMLNHFQNEEKTSPPLK